MALVAEAWYIRIGAKADPFFSRRFPVGGLPALHPNNRHTLQLASLARYLLSASLWEQEPHGLVTTSPSLILPRKRKETQESAYSSPSFP